MQDLEIVPYGPWTRCARLTSGDAELIVTLEVGPRVIHYGFQGGSNEFYVKPEGGPTDTYKSYGGHRFWIAPEIARTTMVPDNDPVEVSQDGAWHCFSSTTDPFYLQKEMALSCDPASGAVRLRHRVYNRGGYAAPLAPWSITQVAPGGFCVFPQHPFVPHSERVLPVRTLALWGYTDLTDPRWTIGSKTIRLRHDANLGPQKIGALVQQGVAVYCNHGNTFLVRFGYDPAVQYPDLGSNFEAFTRHDMQEMESLGAFGPVEPGAYTEHFETWYLLRETAPEGDAEAYDWLMSLADKYPL